MMDFFRDLFGVRRVKNVDELRRYIKHGDIQGLAAWIDWRIVYAKDRLPSEEWKSADQTIADGSGDCEDMAVVAWDVVRSWPGWSAKLFALYRLNPKKPSGWDGHAVCAVTDPYGRRCVVEGSRPYLYPHLTAWGHIFADLGRWEKFYEVDSKGKRV